MNLLLLTSIFLLFTTFFYRLLRTLSWVTWRYETISVTTSWPDLFLYLRSWFWWHLGQEARPRRSGSPVFERKTVELIRNWIYWVLEHRTGSMTHSDTAILTLNLHRAHIWHTVPLNCITSVWFCHTGIILKQIHAPILLWSKIIMYL